MILYIIACLIISFCDATINRTVGEYDKLIFSQRTPGAAYIFIHNQVRYGNMDNQDVMGYLSRFCMVLDPRKWVIHELQSFNSSGNPLIECKDNTGRDLLFIEDVPPEDFRDELKRKWPAFFSCLSEFDLWAANYDFYGSCIKATPIAYFELAMDLLEDYNIARILQASRIVPGNFYDLDRITQSISNALRARPHVRCMPTENKPDEQFLVEVQICFNNVHRPIDCNISQDLPCMRNKTVIYSGWPYHSENN